MEPNLIWVCGACGKTNKTRWGENPANGWDESCSLNASLCTESSLKFGPNGRVTAAEAFEGGRPEGYE